MKQIVSLSWLKTHIGIATIRLNRADVRIGSRSSAAQDIVRIDVGSEEDRSQPPWQASLHALERVMQADSGKRLAKRIRLVLANEFVRYTLVPWKAERLTEAEREQFARALLLERYGEREHIWHLALEPQRFEKPALAAAIEADLMAALQSLAARNGYRLISMIPALVDEINRHRRQLGKVTAGWLVDASDGRLASLAFVGGAWVQVSNERYAGFSAALKEMLVPLLRRDTLRMPDLSGGVVFLANGSGSSMPGAIDQAWPVVRLEGPQSCA
jgi:hypothetical protein